MLVEICFVPAICEIIQQKNLSFRWTLASTASSAENEMPSTGNKGVPVQIAHAYASNFFILVFSFSANAGLIFSAKFSGCK